jgi:hypothetical protein
LAHLPDSDLVIVEAARHLIQRLPREGTIVFPQHVYHTLSVTGSWEDIVSGFHKGTRRERRLTEKHGYKYSVSRDDRDFEAFYHDMYVPTMEHRHGELTSLMPIGEAYQYFRHGFLFFATRDGKRVSGSVFYPDHGTLYFMIMGFLHGDQQWLKEGAVGALNYLRLQWANQRGYKAVSFLGSGARLNSGMFQYKRKWGTTISIPPHLHRLIWIGIQRVNPAVSHFLRENPFIVVDRNRRLHGLIVVDDLSTVSSEARENWSKHYATPGLSDLLVCSVDAFAERRDVVTHPDLVIPISSPDMVA